jgi:dipeptidyl aminopeptidase/acylaminoacyl peptidase
MGFFRGKFLQIVFGSIAMVTSLWAKRLDRVDATEPVPSDQTVPVIDFFRPHYFQQAKINPAGTLVAALNPDKDDSFNLIVFDLEARKTVGTGGGEGFDISNFQWLSDRRLLFSLNKDKLYSEGLFAADADKLQRAIPINRYDLALPIGVPKDDPLKPLVWLRALARQDGKDGGVVQIDSRRDVESRGGGSWTKTFPSPAGGETSAYYTDVNGNLAHAVTMKDGQGTLHRFAGDRWLECNFDSRKLEVVGSGSQPGELIVLAGSDQAGLHPKVLRRFDSVTGTLGEVLYRDENYEPRPVGFFRSPVDHRIVGLSYERKGPETVWLDPEYAQIQKELNEALPGGVSVFFGCDREERKFLVWFYSDRIPVRYFIYQRNPARLTMLANSAPWIDPNRMQPTQLMSYKSRDNVRIEGYLTVPLSTTKALPPLVVLPHGGPWVRDGWMGMGFRGAIFGESGLCRFPAELSRILGHRLAFSRGRQVGIQENA